MAGGKQKQPTMKRTSDTSQVPSFFARWERLETARRESSEDLKELFSEAKAFGLNGRALRVVFAEKYRDENEDAGKRSKRLETGADVELYRSALARVRESDADDEQENLRYAGRAREAQSRLSSSGNEPASVPPTSAAVVEAQPLDIAEEVPKASSAPHSSTQPQGYGGTDAQASVESESTGGENVDHHAPAIENSDVALAGEGRGADPVALGSDVEPVARSNVVTLKSYANDPPHPDCLKPSLCKGYSNIKLCQPCIDAAAGFVQVPHEGSING